MYSDVSQPFIVLLNCFCTLPPTAALAARLGLAADLGHRRRVAASGPGSGTPVTLFPGRFHAGRIGCQLSVIVCFIFFSSM